MNEKRINEQSINRSVRNTAFAAAPATNGHPAVDVSMPMLRPRPNARHLSLSDARSLVEVDDRGKWDIAAPRRDLTLRNGDLEFSGETGRFCGSEDAPVAERLSPTPYALGQICARLGIPVTYLRQCPFILQDQNVNYWLRQGGLKREVLDETEFSSRDRKGKVRPRPEDERWLLRARHGSLRARAVAALHPAR